MVAKYRDRIRYFEIWNEWNIEPYWGDVPDFELYLRIARIAIRVIRELAPESKIVLGSYAGFPRMSHMSDAERETFEHSDMLLRELAPLVDVVGYHPFYALDPGHETFYRYVADIRAFKAYCEHVGFTGSEYFASEFNIAANYPESDIDDWWGKNPTTELCKGKYCARVAALHTAMEIDSFFFETWSSAYPMDLSLKRRMFSSYPVMPVQPSAAYYITRNMSTLLDGLRASGASCELLGEREDVEYHVMEGDDHLAVALWQSGRAKDVSEKKIVSLMADGKYTCASASNPLSGVGQEIAFADRQGSVLIADVCAYDYLVLYEFWKI